MSPRLHTPIPVGPAHLGRPHAFENWKLANRRANRLDQRDYTRRGIACDVWLTDVGSRSVLRCKTDDISDAGLHATAPVGYGLAVGQRYEVRIARQDAMSHDSLPVTKTLGYATVIRTEMRIGGERPDRVGFAVRFDVPQLLPV